MQTFYGLAPSGTLDEATRAAMRRPRCGNHDGEAEDTHQKFVRNGISPRINKSRITWKLTNTDAADLSLEAAANGIGVAFALWGAEMDVTFARVTGSASADITFSFGSTVVARNIGESASAAVPSTCRVMRVPSAAVN